MNVETQEIPYVDENEAKEAEIAMLMHEIDEKVNRFVALTGASGKKVKRRWREIKKSAGR